MDYLSHNRNIYLTNIIRSLTVLVFIVFYSLRAVADSSVEMPLQTPYCKWQISNYEIKKPLCGFNGNAQRGKAIATDGSKGNCLACHRLPIDGIEAYGTIGPPLEGVGERLTEGYIRLRVVDTRSINPMSIMPGFYRDPNLINRPGKPYLGRTFLNAQQVEDVIAYLVTLK